jgi:hypothetical protein
MWDLEEDNDFRDFAFSRSPEQWILKSTEIGRSPQLQSVYRATRRGRLAIERAWSKHESRCREAVLGCWR